MAGVGYCRVPIGDRIELSQVPIALIGYMADGRPGWLSSFEDALGVHREALGTALRRLGVDEQTYQELV